MNKKRLIIMVAAVGILTVATAVFFYLDLNSSNTSNENNDTTVGEQVIPDKSPERVEAPEGFDPNSIENTAREESFEYNDQIISPDTVASNPDDYIGKEITVRGWIVNPSPELFLITSINSDEQKGIILAKNESINFTDYTNPTADFEKASKPVSLTGSFVVNAESGIAEFTVISLNQE